MSSAGRVDITAGLDDTQVKLLEEECILVSPEDKQIGAASKKVCHLLDNINKGMLHRAFSVFMFNNAGQLLLQQRSHAKITYPGHWTNTCCSHPLHTLPELEEADALGVKIAAQRKLKHELGIKPKQVPLDCFHYLTRIHYRSDNVPRDGLWGEHEIDYVLIAQRDVDVVPNENEVKNHRFVDQDQLKQLMDDATTTDTLITPWFKLIVKNFLFPWWNNLDQLERFVDHDKINVLT